jgi:putative FmdB family regulatory protein
MPLYEYYCPACNYQIDIIQKVSDRKQDLCPLCKKMELKRKTSLTSFQLKGGGWYKDGYFKKEQKPAAEKKVGSDKGQKKEAKKKDVKQSP